MKYGVDVAGKAERVREREALLETGHIISNAIRRVAAAGGMCVRGGALRTW